MLIRKAQLRETEGFAVSLAFVHQLLDLGELLGVIGGKVSDRDISIQAPHNSEKPSAIALFIASTETGFFRRGRIIPLRDRMSLLRGVSETFPFESTRNSTRWPV
jgi:hypothetical protein